MSEHVVGRFRLLEKAGHGGMGEVWRAEHLDQRGVAAAIKFVHVERVADEKYRAQFRDEARAMASLNHPAIAKVFDYGEAGGIGVLGIAEGTPYLAMEWAPGGTLADVVPFADWAAVRNAALEVLDGIAHAHARGLIHRDLKPRNILVGKDGRLRLVDFGLARRHRGDDITESRIGTSGTPRWMAPEQIAGKARDQGPWTDLYALGCVVFWLLTGQAPFVAGGLEGILRGHLYDPVPKLQARMSVPDAVEPWLGRLLAKSPHRRYRFAADAAYDLLGLPEEFGESPPDAVAALSPPPDTLPETALATLAVLEPDDVVAEERRVAEAVEPPTPRTPRPPPPRSWVRAEAPVWPIELVGAGIGLWGLRAIPLVGRRAERDTLWDRLRRVGDGGGGHAVVLRGSTGTGKSRLAQWLIERATELGAAHVMRAHDGPIAGPGTGFAGMVGAHFRAKGMARNAAAERIRKEFAALGHAADPLDASALADAVCRFREPVDPSSGESRRRAWNAWLRYLGALSDERAVIVWLDDVHWGADTLGFVQHALDTSAAVRVMFVLTARDELLARRPVEAARLRNLVAGERVSEIRIEPLGSGERTELVERLLYLEPALARTVADRTQGNPLFAVELVDDWVRRGVLVVGDDGFELAPGSDAELPETLRNVWTSLLGRFLDEQPSPRQARNALEIAAVLGQQVDAAEWRAVCVRVGVEIPGGLVESLQRAGLAVGRTTAWSFCHGMFREAVEARARSGGRAESWHAACAEFVAEEYGFGHENALRYAEHSIAAGRHQDALGPMLIAAEFLARQGDLDRVRDTLNLRDDLLDRLGHGVTPERVRGVVHRARLEMFERNLDEIDAELRRAERMCETLEDAAVAAETALTRARYFRFRGMSAEAIPHAERALEAFDRVGDAEHAATARRALGELYRRMGRFDEAIASYTTALEAFTELGDHFQAGWCWLGLASTVKQTGDYEPHSDYVDAAIASFEEVRSFASIAGAHNERAEALRTQGRNAEALVEYEEALRNFDDNHSNAGIVQMNVGLTHVAMGNWNEARHWLRMSTASFHRHGKAGTILYVEVAMLVCAAGEGAWSEFDSLRTSALPRLAESGRCETDFAQLLEQAGRLCREGGRDRDAAELWELAADHWRRLGRAERAEQLDRLG